MENDYSQLLAMASEWMKDLLRYVHKPWFFYQILSISAVYGSVRMLGGRIDQLEEQIILGTDQETRSGLLDLRREIIMLRRFFTPQREALNRLYRVEIGWLSKANRMLVREAADALSRYVGELDAARDRAGVAYEEISNHLAEQMNSRMYILSIVAGIFLPLGFLTGLLSNA